MKRKKNNKNHYEKRTKEKKRLREKQKKQFLQLKKPEKFRVSNALCIQDTIEIRKTSPEGIFEVGENRYSITYQMNDLNYVTKTYEEQELFFGEWCRILNALDVHLCKITVFNKNRNMEEFRANVLYPYQKDGFDFARECYNDIMESKIINSKRGIEQIKYLTITITRNNYDDAKLAFNSITANLVKEFASIGCLLLPLNAKERLRIFHDFYRMGEESAYDFDIQNCLSQMRDFRNDIVCDRIDFSENPAYFRTNIMYGKCMCIEPDSYPDDELSDDFFDELINISQRSMFSIDMVPIAKAATKDFIEGRYMAVQSKIQKQQQKRNKNNDFSLDISYPVRMENEDIEEMLEDTTKNGQKMFWVGIHFVLLGKSLEEVEEASDNMDLIIENHGCYSNDLILRQREALATILPYGTRHVDSLRSMFTRMAAILIPFKVMEMQMKKQPFYYGCNKESKNVILCNRKQLINGNGFVFGVTGSGKSLTGSKLEIGSVFLNTDDDIIIVDPTHEYIDVAKAFDGSFIEISPHSTNWVNPLDCDVSLLNAVSFDKKQETSEELEDGTDLIQIIAQKSQIMCGIAEHSMEQEFKPQHASIIDRCIKILFTDIASHPIEERKVPIMSDFYEVLKQQRDEEVHDIVLAMERFIDGSFNTFNHPTSIDVKNRVTVYGIRDIGEQLMSVGMLITLSNIRQRIIKNASIGRATWLYVDEFHELMNKKYSKAFFISLWKKVRKLGGICTGITQNVSDVINDNDSMKLISNSEYTMFLKMGPGDAKLILDTFEGKISSAHLAYIENPSPGCGLIRFANTIIPLDNTINKDNPIYDVFNTNFYEKHAIKVATASKIG